MTLQRDAATRASDRGDTTAGDPRQATGIIHSRKRHKNPRSGEARAEERSAWVMMAPALVLLLLFLILPAILGFGLSFTNARLVSPNAPRFVGLDNFRRALTGDDVLARSTLNTFYFALVVVPVHSGLALVLALLVNARLRGSNVFRAVYFLPVVTSMAAVSVVWRFIYQDNGLLNSMLSTFSGSAIQGMAWLTDPGTAMPAVMLMSIWQAVGFHMLIWLAGLQSIPAYLYEAATIDGAGAWARFRHVTWPGLTPTLVLVVITETIGALSVFTQIKIMTNGGPQDATTTVVFQAVQQGWRIQNVGYASAISLLFFVVVLAISLAQNVWARGKD